MPMYEFVQVLTSKSFDPGELERRYNELKLRNVKNLDGFVYFLALIIQSKQVLNTFFFNHYHNFI
jgi:hypothetical protein